MRPLLLILVLAATVDVHAEAPYGAQGLAHLAEDATLVFTSTGATRLQAPANVAAFSVRVSETLRGTAPSSSITVISRRSDEFEFPATSAFANAIVFVRGPVTLSDRADWHSDPGSVYMLTSGHHGVVPNTPTRLRAIREYLRLGPQDAAQAEQLTWADTALSSGDTFLQESAVLLASNLLVDQPAEAADVLARATATTQLSLELREHSIMLLGTAGTGEALAALEGVAMNRAVPFALRNLAARTFLSGYREAKRR